MQADPKLLELLVCPLTHTTLRYDAARGELVSDAAGLAFPVRDGVPVMMAGQARPLEEHERKK
ncbi:MAG: Trm112 family protein [Rhodospirillales bacterium]|nr:Trm112 family protein [Alphaproteobacteria bacterium]MCB9986643.1 Trm112 family protein [Rhodospirillales bacterium]USO06829.1 MAG: Trm112 family protein [Rhodospirillales bacterium]